MAKQTRGWMMMLVLGCMLGCMASPTGEEFLASARQRGVGAYCNATIPCGFNEHCAVDNTCQRNPNPCSGIICGWGEHCLDGLCVPESVPSSCQDTFDCDPGEACVNGLCQTGAQGLCTDNSQCHWTEYCNAFGRCANAECAVDGECGPGQRCSNNQCIPSE